jgi:hypothetical protein
VSSQCSAYARLRRSLDSRHATVAYAAATELDFVSLPEALELVLLVVDDPRPFRRTALRWHARYCAEVPDVGFAGRSRRARRCCAGREGRGEMSPSVDTKGPRSPRGPPALKRR